MNYQENNSEYSTMQCDCNIIHQEVVDEVLKKMPKYPILEELANLYKLIGDSTRCRILFALDQHEMCVCDLANVLNMTKSSISHQLSILKKNEIVKSRKSGKEVYYTLDDDHIYKLFEIGLEHTKHQKLEKKEG